MRHVSFAQITCNCTCDLSLVAFLLPAQATEVLFSASLLRFFLCQHHKSQTAALCFMKFCTNTYLNNPIEYQEVTGQHHMDFVVFLACMILSIKPVGLNSRNDIR